MKKMPTNRSPIRYRLLEDSMQIKLADYLNNLSPDTKKRFAPHPFTISEINRLLKDNKGHKLFVAINPDLDLIIAYSIVKMGWLEFDAPRLRAYGLIQEVHDCTLAPSVGDGWQGKGIGSGLFNYMLENLTSCHISRIILWGGVQSDNEKAIGFYRKFGFKTLGEFEHNGNNLDMMLKK